MPTTTPIRGKSQTAHQAQPTAKTRAAARDPKEWTSKVDLLKSDNLWIDTPGSPYHTLQVAYGIDQITPLLVNELQDDTFLLSGNLKGRNEDETAVTNVLTAGYFIYSATAGEVQRIVEPMDQDKIWVMLGNDPDSIMTEEVSPLKF